MSLGIAAFVVVVDQVSKLIVRSRIMPWESVPARDGVFRLTHVQNSGSAFGLFSSQTALLAVVSLIAIFGLVMALRYQPLRNFWASLALGLLLGGSIGNLIDRIRLGYVTDFIDIGVPNGWRFYTFNAADSAITAGAILMAVVLLFMGQRQSPAGSEKAPPDTSTGK